MNEYLLPNGRTAQNPKMCLYLLSSTFYPLSHHPTIMPHVIVSELFKIIVEYMNSTSAPSKSTNLGSMGAAR